MSNGLTTLRDLTLGTPWEGRLWVVGGAVRDALLRGLPPDAIGPILLSSPSFGPDVNAQDVDVMVEGDALAVARAVFDAGASTHAPVVYPRFGTAMLCLDGLTVELATARRESYDESSRKPHVEPASRLEDALRRDFTLNALSVNLHTGKLSDPLGQGLADLQNRTLRTPRAPLVTFSDDPLRMLRAVRFRWRFGLNPAPGLFEAIRESGPRLAIVSPERRRDELLKTLVGPDPDAALDDWRQLGLLPHLIPELEDLVGVEQGPYHHLDVWDHTRLVVRNTPPEEVLRLAALLHDIAKPATRWVDEKGNARFFGHETEGADLTRTILRRLHCSNDVAESVATLVRHHMRLGTATTFTPTAARRLLRDLGPDVERLLALVEADASALRPGVRRLDLGPIREQLARVSQATPRERLKSPLSGDEVQMLLGWTPGPAIGSALRHLEHLVLEGELDPVDRERATEALRRWAATQP